MIGLKKTKSAATEKKTGEQKQKMGSGKRGKRSKTGKSLKPRNPSNKKLALKSKNKKTHDSQNTIIKKTKIPIENIFTILPPAEQLSFFLDRLTNGAHLSFLELEFVKDTCLVELSQGLDQSADNLVEHMKAVFGSSWKEMLCEKHPTEGKIEPGNPSLIVISLSALRSLEVHRALRPLTSECPAAKLFSKHMKVEEQVSFLKSCVNIACGTPSRIKKLIDIEALGLTRLKVIVLDMHTDVKGYSLFSLPQIRDEFWELYRSYFHRPLVQGDTRVCLYGPTQDSSYLKKKNC